jgi:hypothetical protein
MYVDFLVEICPKFDLRMKIYPKSFWLGAYLKGLTFPKDLRQRGTFKRRSFWLKWKFRKIDPWWQCSSRCLTVAK